MEINKEVIENVAKVARLNLTEEEKQKFILQLKEVLESFSKLSEVNTNNIKESFQPVEIKNSVRQDEVEESLTQDQALINSVNKKDGYFKGPKAV